MPRDIALESEEWYVLCNWLRSRENRAMYALRSRSEEWEYVYELRRSIETQLGDTEETGATLQTVTLSDASVAYLARFLRRRALFLLFKPWRDRERRDVRRLRRQLLARADGA
ncbi:hypothetical protein [Halopelagius fulvigenes]|uniref:Sigma-70 family RNA polymerase sigma factor n=1 Tax=Halopelagius fulvigenes TaxID=1198324 RepID=A0ABD5U2M5_9EURY